MAEELCDEYVSMFGAEPLPHSGIDDEAAAGRLRKLTFHLNHSGKYLAMRRRLKAAVCALARERFAKPLDADAAPELFNALYVYAVDHMHAALNKMIRPDAEQQDAQAAEKAALRRADASAALAKLAAECEAADDVARAELLHRERCGPLIE